MDQSKKLKNGNVSKEAKVYVERKEINEFEQKPVCIDDDKNEKLKLEAEEKKLKLKKYNEKAKGEDEWLKQ